MLKLINQVIMEWHGMTLIVANDDDGNFSCHSY